MQVPATVDIPQLQWMASRFAQKAFELVPEKWTHEVCYFAFLEDMFRQDLTGNTRLNFVMRLSSR